MLVAVHAANRLPGHLAQGSNAALFASLAPSAAVTSNFASYSVNQKDENLEWNVWSHATHLVAYSPAPETPLHSERSIFSLIPTNR